MSPTEMPKVHVTLFCILVGIGLAFAAVVSDHWAVLSPHMEHHNTTCEAAHFGLWRICIKRIPLGEDKSCGPITLPGGNVPTPHPLLIPSACGKEGRFLYWGSEQYCQLSRPGAARAIGGVIGNGDGQLRLLFY